MLSPADLRLHIELARSNLENWREPHGHLVPTEPNREEWARLRISLRGFLSGLLLASGETSPPPGFEADDHRDLQRIRDAAVEDEQAARESPPRRTSQHPSAEALYREADQARHIAAALDAAGARVERGERADEGLSAAHRMASVVSHKILNLTAALYGVQVSQRLCPTTHSVGLFYAERCDQLHDRRAGQMSDDEATLADIIGAGTLEAATRVAESMGTHVLAHLAPAFKENEAANLGALYTLRVLGALLSGTAEDMITAAGGLPALKDAAAKRSLLDCPKCALDREVDEAAKPVANAIDLERWDEALAGVQDLERRFPGHPGAVRMRTLYGMMKPDPEEITVEQVKEAVADLQEGAVQPGPDGKLDLSEAVPTVTLYVLHTEEDQHRTPENALEEFKEDRRHVHEVTLPAGDDAEVRAACKVLAQIKDYHSDGDTDFFLVAKSEDGDGLVLVETGTAVDISHGGSRVIGLAPAGPPDDPPRPWT